MRLGIDPLIINPTPDAAGQAAVSKAPTWDLSDLYESPEDPAIETDFGAIAEAATTFRERFQGKVDTLDAETFGEAIALYEGVTETLHKIGSYSQLLHAGQVDDPAISRFYQTVSERITDISSELLFFTLEINRLADDRIEAFLGADDVARYAPWIRDVRLYRDHQLSDDLEQLLHQKSVTGRSAWNRLFDETMAAMRFEIGDKKLAMSEVLNRLSDSDQAVRKQAAKALGAGLESEIRLFTLITNTLAKDKEIEDKWRKYPAPISSRNLDNQIEDEVVEALVSAVREAYPRLSHRYYRIKAGWYGGEKLDYWDRNAPMPGRQETKFDWTGARDMVLNAYGAFEPKMAEIAEIFFDKRWIDAELRDGKDSGAFSHPTVPSVHPYILMNFHGKARDVMTLAHELGHGVHQVLSGPQGALMADTPLTLAETASVFGEMLTFQSILAAEQDPAARKALLAGKIEDMMNTVVRQIAFHEFETHVHGERRSGELSTERLGEIWMDVQGESLGPALRFEDEYKHYWAYIPHFIHVPFYVYAYAFGDCLVNSLYDVFESGHPGFQQKYLEMLKAGGTLRHKELLAPFGLDASDPAFWSRGLAVVERLIDQLEALPD